METIQYIRETYSILLEQADLSPENIIVNMTIERLLSCLAQCHLSSSGDVLVQNNDLQDVRQQLPKLYGAVESEKERYWARHFIKKNITQLNDLAEYSGYDKYVTILNLEQDLFGALKAKRFILLGSGSFPLTAIVAAVRNSDLKIVCVDYDVEACDLSRQLIAKINFSDRLMVVQTSAMEFAYQSDDFVICTSSLTQKQDLYKILHKAGVRDLAIRSPEGVYCLLYEPSSLPPKTQYQELRRTIPDNLSMMTTYYFSHMS